MPPYTKLPRPEGHLHFSYSPMSPPNWGIVPAEIHIFVYRNVHIALQALMQAATTIQAQRLEAGSAEFLGENLFFRGQSEVTQRLLPTRLRGSRNPPTSRQRFGVGAPPKVKFNDVELPSNVFESGGADPRDHWGDWFERVEPMPSAEGTLSEISDDELNRRDALEQRAIDRGSRLPELTSLDGFRRRSAIRHYSGAPSSLLDVSTSPEVAAFFATGGASRPPTPGSIGILWAIDINFFQDLFALTTTSIPGGEKITLAELREDWGANKQFFEDYGVLPASMQLASVELPFHRPQAQHARFLSLAGEGASSLPTKTELVWWSIIERRAYACAFFQDGCTYENVSHNITTPALWPDHEPLAMAFNS